MDKPLLVSNPLIRPISNGRKTETRRLKGLEFINGAPETWEFVANNGGTFEFQKIGIPETCHLNCPYGKPGDTLWVRENWYVGRGYNDLKPRDIPKGDHVKRGYMGDAPRAEWAGKVRPSIHMPRWLCRYELELTAVRVERLHAITEKDAEREGVDRGIYRDGPNVERGEFQLELTSNGSALGDYLNGFKFTWITLNGRDSWELNPWVYVLSFKLKTKKNANSAGRVH